MAEAAARIAAVAPDVLALQGIDWDAGGLAIGAIGAALEAAGHAMPYVHAGPTNRGVPATADGDLDGDGRTLEGDDMHGWARYTGEGAMAILSRHPLGPAADLSGLLWADLPGRAAHGGGRHRPAVGALCRAPPVDDGALGGARGPARRDGDRRRRTTRRPRSSTGRRTATAGARRTRRHSGGRGWTGRWRACLAGRRRRRGRWSC